MNLSLVLIILVSNQLILNSELSHKDDSHFSMAIAALRQYGSTVMVPPDTTNTSDVLKIKINELNNLNNRTISFGILLN